jgi:hypothetical protein
MQQDGRRRAAKVASEITRFRRISMVSGVVVVVVVVVQW